MNSAEHATLLSIVLHEARFESKGLHPVAASIVLTPSAQGRS